MQVETDNGVNGERVAARVERLVSPFYDRDGITIYNATWQEALPFITGVNCVVTSPPYNQRLDQISGSGFKKESVWAERIASSYSDSRPESEYQCEQALFLAKMLSVTTDNASVFYNHKIRWRDGEWINPVDWCRWSGWKIRQEIIWHRDGSLTQNAKMFPPDEERIIWMDKGKHKWNQEAARFLSVWRINSEKMSPHPVAYPVTIPSRCIVATCEAGDLVLDPFMGSGTTLLAAKRLGMRAIGIEVEAKYCEMAVERLRERSLDFDSEG